MSVRANLQQIGLRTRKPQRETGSVYRGLWAIETGGLETEELPSLVNARFLKQLNPALHTSKAKPITRIFQKKRGKCYGIKL